MITHENIQQIANDLKGTAQSLDALLAEGYGTEFSEVPTELLYLLDQEVMQCVNCGWWEDSENINDDQVCEECEGAK